MSLCDWSSDVCSSDLYLANDVNGNYPSAGMNPHTYADLGRQLARRGHAVLRYAKVGPDTGSVVVDEKKAAEHRIFPQQQYIAAAACNKIRELVPQAKSLVVNTLRSMMTL